MSTAVHRREEFYAFLVDRFEPEEILLYMKVSIEDILDAFPDQWEENEILQDMSDLYPNDEDDDE